MAIPGNHNEYSTRFVDLAQPRLGADVVSVSDDFFAPCARMLKPEPAVFVPGKYDQNGKWMDGWESRRKRVPGHDYAIVRLGVAGTLRGVDIDTSHFIGNHPPFASLEACHCEHTDPNDKTPWVEVLAKVSLQANAHNLNEIIDRGIYTHIRLNIFPDGGVARLRVYGQPYRDWDQQDPDELIDLVALENGGRAIACSEESFGSSMLKLNLPDRGIDMGDGWETSRRRGPGHDWVILALGHAGVITAVDLDTAHYKGNYPDRASLQGAFVEHADEQILVAQSDEWPELLPQQKLTMDAIHHYEHELLPVGALTHVRVNIFPDGGLSRVRFFGRLGDE